MSTDPRLVYVGDPMCSWCWGFAPVLEELTERSGLEVEVVVGGLRPGASARRLSDGLGAFLRTEWSRIEGTTGQPFRHDRLDEGDWSYDTLLPAVAVVLVRAVEPPRALPFFLGLQRAFYQEGVDITSPQQYRVLLERAGVDPQPILRRLSEAESEREAYGDFERARQLGATGFPSLFLRSGEETLAITRGYASASPLLLRLEQALEAVT